jgi:nitrite reductase (NADH) small subunit
MHLIQIKDSETEKMESTSLIAVCQLDELPVGLGRAFQIAGKTIAIFRTRAGKLFATNNSCPHKNGPLSEGILSGDSVVCPLHQFRFDMKSGLCDQENVCSVKTYDVTLDGTTVYIQL